MTSHGDTPGGRPAQGSSAQGSSAQGGETAEAGATVSPWRGTTAELVIAAVLVTVTAVAGYVMASWAGLAVAPASEVSPPCALLSCALLSWVGRPPGVSP